MVRLLSGDEGRERGEREVDTGEGHQVRLELVEVDVEGAVETERGGDRGDDLRNETVKVGEAGLLDTETLLADVENSLVVDLQKSNMSEPPIC